MDADPLVDRLRDFGVEGTEAGDGRTRAAEVFAKAKKAKRFAGGAGCALRSAKRVKGQQVRDEGLPERGARCHAGERRHGEDEERHSPAIGAMDGVAGDEVVEGAGDVKAQGQSEGAETEPVHDPAEGGEEEEL